MTALIHFLVKNDFNYVASIEVWQESTHDHDNHALRVRETFCNWKNELQTYIKEHNIDKDNILRDASILFDAVVMSRNSSRFALND